MKNSDATGNACEALNRLSSYRACVMATAIMGVLICHSKQLHHLSPMFGFGSIGVEMFFFLSGMGLCYSWHKCPQLWTFWRKRFVRLFPAYFCVLFFIGCIIDSSILTLPNLLVITCTSRWFIGWLCVCYLLFPLYMYLCSRISPWCIYICIVLLSAVVLWSNYGMEGLQWTAIENRFGRLPTFFLGCLFVQYGSLSRHTRVLYGISLVAFLCLLPCMVMIKDLCGHLGITMVLRTAVTPGLCFGVALLFEYIRQKYASSIAKFLLNLSVLVGSLTLEIYLCEAFLRNGISHELGEEREWLYFILVIPTAYAFQQLCKPIQRVLSAKNH